MRQAETVRTGHEYVERQRAAPPQLAGAAPAHAGKRSFRRRVIAIGLPTPEAHGHPNGKCSMWHHLCSLVT